MKCFWLVSLALASTLVACSGNMYPATVGSMCPPDLKPDPPIAGSQKPINMKDSDQAIPKGIYNYNGASLYFFANNGVHIQINDVKQADGSFSAGAGCVSGAHIGNMDGLTAETEGLTNFTMGADSKTSAASAKKFSFVHAPKGKLVWTFKVASDVAPDQSPENFYQNKGSTEPKMVFMGDNNYEIRSQGINSMGTWYLTVRYARTNLKK